MLKNDEIKLLEEIQFRFLKLLNVKNGYIKDQCKELIDLKVLECDIERMMSNIHSDFMPLIGTRLNIYLDLQKRRRYLYRDIIKNLNAYTRLIRITIHDQAKELYDMYCHQEKLLEDVLEELYKNNFDLLSKKELLQVIELKFKEYNNIQVIEKKIDMGIELLPDEKKLIKNLMENEKRKPPVPSIDKQ